LGVTDEMAQKNIMGKKDGNNEVAKDIIINSNNKFENIPN